VSVESDLFDALQSLVSGRCYPDEAPSGAALPYIVYQQIGGESVLYMENVLPSKKNGRFQVAVWATTRTQAASLSLSAEAAVVASTDFQATPLGAAVADIDAQTDYRGMRQDFSVWSDR
jgi:Protein of unknown function (DUF3168)